MTIDSCGQAFMQSLHFVQRSRKIASPTAPGGRSQSVRRAGAGFSGTASAWEENSFAAFATEMTESLKKSRRPYFGSVATGWCALLFQEMVPKGSRFSGSSSNEVALEIFSDLLLHDAVGPKLVHLDAAVAGTEVHVPAGMILADEVEHVGLDLGPHVLYPCISR